MTTPLRVFAPPTGSVVAGRKGTEFGHLTARQSRAYVLFRQTDDKVLAILPGFCFTLSMLKHTTSRQLKMEFVCIGDLVPKEHLLRKISMAIGFEFIREKVKGLYCADNGRPAVDPVVLFKMLFLGYIFGIRSERQLVREIEVNVAYRWFLGFSLTDKIPHASTFSQNRRRRFLDSPIYQDIFDEIVLQALRRGMVDDCVKVATRHIRQEYKEEINKHRYENRGKQVYKRRKETVERSFADGKELHGHRSARFRGRHRVQMQCLLSAACQNMKKIALLVWRGLPDDGQRLAQCCLNTISPWQRQIFPSALAA